MPITENRIKYGFFILKNYEKLEKLKEIWKLERIVLNAKKIIKKIGDDILIISKYGKQEKIVFILIIFQSWIVIILITICLNKLNIIIN